MQGNKLHLVKALWFSKFPRESSPFLSAEGCHYRDEIVLWLLYNFLLLLFFNLKTLLNDFLILFEFWKLIRSHTVTPSWLGNAKECIQWGWSKQRDCCSFAHEFPAVNAGRFENCISQFYLAVSTWILNGSLIECHEKKHQPFILSYVWFGSRAIQNFWVKICLALEESKMSIPPLSPSHKV